MQDGDLTLVPGAAVIRSLLATGVAYLAVSASIAAGLATDGQWRYPLLAPLALAALAFLASLAGARSR
jgi:hypothetical protein